MRGRRCSTTTVEKAAAIDPEVAAIFRHMGNYQAVRTHFFDEYFAKAAAAGIRQIVILASGLDSRAYRIEWPAATTVFEIDQPKVLEYKAATLAENGVKPSAQLREVPMDLRHRLAEGVARQRFRRRPADRVAGRGPADVSARRRAGPALRTGHRAQRPDSRIAVETVGIHAEERREQMRERFERMADQLGIERTFDLQELMYNDPDRADVAEWLGGHGWRATP